MPLGARLRQALAGSLTPSDRVPTMGPMGGERGRKRAAERAVPSRGSATRSGASSSGRQSTSAAPQVAAGTFEPGPVLTNDDVLELQRTAGNRAVSTVMQRAAGPLDETVPGVAVADTLPQAPASSEGAVAVAPSPAQAAGAGTGAGRSCRRIDPRLGRAGPGATGGDRHRQPASRARRHHPHRRGRADRPGRSRGPRVRGAVDQTAKRAVTAKAVPMPDHAVEATYAADPSRVFRSPSDQWHYDLWNFQKGPGFTDEPPTGVQGGRHHRRCA